MSSPGVVQAEVLEGSSADVLAELPAGHFHCAVTSPPYWRLRDYAAAGQIGQEATLEAYIARLVNLFREVKRVLRPDGSLWLNLGDTYREKQLLGVPWRVAIALQADGWVLRSEVIWHKPNATPESVRDRPSRDHEHLFLLTPSKKYFFDYVGVLEEQVSPRPRGAIASDGRTNYRTHNGRWAKNWDKRHEVHGGFESFNPRGRRRRTTWSIPSSCFDPASVGRPDIEHFAIYPPRLIRPCLLASTSSGGCCSECGAPRLREVRHWERPGEDDWKPGCSCSASASAPCRVLDPFGGSGTTAEVALRLGRSATLIEINAQYAELARARIDRAIPHEARATP